MRFLDKDFAFESGSVGKLLPRVSVFSSDAGGGAERDRGGGAGNYPSCFGPNEGGDHFAGVLEQIDHADKTLVDLLHGLPDAG